LECNDLLLSSSRSDFGEGQRNDNVAAWPQCDVCESALKKLPCAEKAAEAHEKACSEFEPVFGYGDSCERQQNLHGYWGSSLRQLKTSPDPAERPGLRKGTPSK
jgi:hypothetical protein